MNFKKSINNNKLLFTAPVIIGGIIGLVIAQPKRTQSTDIASPIASEVTQSISSDGGRMDSSEVIQGNESANSKQPLDTYLLSAQSLLTKAITLSRRHSDPEPKVVRGEESPDGANPERIFRDTQDDIKERNQQIVNLINEAIDTTNQAIAQYPNSAPAYAQQAKIYQTITAYMPQAQETAIAYWQQAIMIDDKNPTYHTSLADLYLSSIGNGDHNLDLALYHLQKAVEADPTNPNRHQKLAEIQAQAGYISQAKITYQRLLSILNNENQIAKIQTEINSLNKLLAEAASASTPIGDGDDARIGNVNRSGDEAEPNGLPNLDRETIVLPDSPPKLQASHLASTNVYIAEPKDSLDSGQMDSEVSLTNAKSGSATIPAGEKEIEICNNHLGPETQVYLVPEDDSQNVILFVKSKSPYNPESGHCPNFIAATAKPVDKDLHFRWWIIEK